MQAAQTLDAVRRNNLSRVLRLVHQRRQITRAEITRVTGLTRAGVKLLTDALVEMRICCYGEPEHTSRSGRPSAVVVPDPRLVTIALNVDRRGLDMAVARLGAVFSLRMHRDLDGTESADGIARITADMIAEARRDLPDDAVIVGVGASVPGHVRNGVVWAPSVGWRGADLRLALVEATGLESFVGFDADLGLTAESVWGDARAADHSAYVWGGPGGIGTALMYEGRLIPAVAGIGHVLVGGDRECSCGAVGCLQVEVAEREIDAVLAAGEAGRASLDEAVAKIARALRELTMMFAPDTIVLDGFLARVLESSRDELELAVRGVPNGAVTAVDLRSPRMTSDLLLSGAADLAFQPLLTDPAIFAID